jgi:hypothetical protein
VFNATGVRVPDLPLTPDTIIMALASRNASPAPAAPKEGSTS